jgi:hypothetical protein
LLAPALFDNDERGYFQTSLITTPLISAGYMALDRAMPTQDQVSPSCKRKLTSRAGHRRHRPPSGPRACLPRFGGKRSRGNRT